MSTSTSTVTAEPTASLYQRLGAAQGIRAIVDDIVAAHLVNPVISTRFLPFADHPRLPDIKQHLCDMLGAGSGGPEQYTGRSMEESHRGMNVSEAEYVAAVDDILRVLEAHGVDEQSRKDVLAIAWSLKGQIVHQ